MAYVDNARWESLERWSATAFIVAGALFLITSILFGSETITDISHPWWLTGLFGLSGLLASFTGLAGVYPQLTDRAPRVARAGVTTMVIAGIALVAFPLCQIGKTWGLDLQPLPIVVFLLAILGTIGGFLLFGIASLRTRVPSRAVGGLLLATATSFIVVFIVDMVYRGSPVWADSVMNGGQALLLLTTGYVMPTNTIPIESTESTRTTLSG